MAEAVAERDTRPPRFYCHVCKQEFTNITTEYTCPICSDGFIEELHDADPSPSSSSSSSNSGNIVEMDVLDLLNTGFRDGSGSGNSGLSAPFRLLRTPAGDPRTRIRRPPHHHHHHHHHHPHPWMGPPTHPATTSTASGTTDGQPAPAMINAYDQLIRDFFAYVGVPGVSGAGAAAGANGRRLIATGGAPGRAGDQLTLTPMFFVGNPGDYVWGHDGLDSVITLMLNQLEPTGPPPMTAQKIDEIPKWEIGAEELDKKMQCSVCLEDFQLQEQCRKLACAHIFHEPCIVPWLELHGTCPICRDTFTEGQEGGQPEDMETDAAPTNRFENLLGDVDTYLTPDPRTGFGALDSNLPRTVSSRIQDSGSATAGVIGSVPGSTHVNSTSTNNSSSSSSNNNHNSSSNTNAMSSQSTNNEGSSSSTTRNSMNFHLDDGLD